jgi:4-hydroxybenzoate polyprenyltransferase
MSFSLTPYIRIARPRHWIKNGFVIAPAFFAGHIQNLSILPKVIGAFFIFCFLSSAVYIFNDLRDCEDDKLHAKKKTRPLASGKISKTSAAILMAVFLFAAAAVTFWLEPPVSFISIALLYVFINISYSMGLKHISVLELFLLGSGYMLRLMAGAEFIHEPLTGWIIAATALVALLMAAGKRRGDLLQENDVLKKRKSLDGYTLAFLDQIMSMLAAATVVTYLLFCISDYAIARFGAYTMWSAIFVLYGIMRYMQIVMVEGGGDSPTTLIYTDKPMIITIFLFGLFFALNLYVLR